MALLSLREIAFLLNNHVESECLVLGFCVDTRQLRQGALFFALPGARTDGHHFLACAAALGAIAAVVHTDYKGPHYGMGLIYVRCVLSALQALARHVISQTSAQIVAITGSVGKTTTKEFTSSLLKRKRLVAQTPGNSNSQIGLPLSILNNVKGDEDVLVLEMGLTQKGQIANLVGIAPPDIAVITTTGLVHAENFDSLEAIGRAKAEIFSHPKTRLGVLHYDISNYREICHHGSCLKISFSTTAPQADYYLTESAGQMQISGDKFPPITLPCLEVFGQHNKKNFLSAAIVARHLGMTWGEIAEAAKELELPEKRLERIEKKGIFFVNDSYNASELSVKAALESLPAPRRGAKRVAVLGEMLELGRFSAESHRSIGEHALDFADVLICYGHLCQPALEAWQKAGRPAFLVADQQSLFQHVKDVVESGDVVLLKGSQSKEMWKILDEF